VGVLIVAGAIAAACTGGQEEGDVELVPEIVSSDLAVGPNTFSLGLLTQEKEIVLGAQVHARFFQQVGDQLVLRGEGDLQPVEATLSYTETRPDGTTRTIETGQITVYKANVEFDQAGIWSVEVTATVEGKTYDPVTAAFQVRGQSLSPAIGDPAHRSHQTILADVADISEIDTSDPPDPDMHAMTIAEAVTSGKPTVIVFATPGFCVSRTCGPTKQAVDELYPKYKDQVNFVHVEPYFLEQARQGIRLCPVPIFNLRWARERLAGVDCPQLAPEQLPPPEEDWRLETEPWVFLVDKQGNIAAKFEAVVSYQELEAALQVLL